MLVTSPNLAYNVMPQAPSPLRRALWVTILTTALPSLLYHSSGYVQFGYRYSLDYLVFFVVLLAISSRPLTKLFRGLVLCSFVVNLFLAITFDRYMQFSYDDCSSPTGTTSRASSGRRRSGGLLSGDRRGSRRRESRHRLASCGTRRRRASHRRSAHRRASHRRSARRRASRHRSKAGARRGNRRPAPAHLRGSLRWGRRTQERYHRARRAIHRPRDCLSVTAMFASPAGCRDRQVPPPGPGRAIVPPGGVPRHPVGGTRVIGGATR